jgi:hypothetical protein
LVNAPIKVLLADELPPFIGPPTCADYGLS